MDIIHPSITNGILKEINDAEITIVTDIIINPDEISEKTLNAFDLLLCDLTTLNPNVLYVAGRVEHFCKPIIYFKSNKTVMPFALMHRRVLIYSEASLSGDFQKELSKLILEAKSDPTKFITNSLRTTVQPKAFISYSQKDRSYLDRLMVHLKPLIKKNLIDIWVDTKIKTGDHWKEEIEKALREAKIAILLISADFMASDFIIENELPPLLSDAEIKGTKILPVIISPCRFSREPSLNRFQAANSPSEPLSSMNENKKEKVYDQLAHDIEESLKST